MKALVLDSAPSPITSPIRPLAVAAAGNGGRVPELGAGHRAARKRQPRSCVAANKFPEDVC
jgi:hypothetical protein